MDVKRSIVPICFATLAFASACGEEPEPLIGTWNLVRVNNDVYPSQQDFGYYDEACVMTVSVSMEIEDDLDGEMTTRFDADPSCDYDSETYVDLLEADPDGDGEYEIRLYDRDGGVTLFDCETHGDRLECRDGGDMLFFESD